MAKPARTCAASAATHHQPNLTLDGYLLSEDAHRLLERAERAADLLACLDGEVAYMAGIDPRLMAAVADYIGTDLRAALAECTYAVTMTRRDP